MSQSRHSVVLGAAALALALLSWSVQGQSAADGSLSIAEVQAFIEEKVAEGVPVDEVISSGLKLGYRPELLAAALLNLSVEPAVIAVALVSEGVSRGDAAKAVISVAGPPSSERVLEALLIGAPPEEAQTLAGQVAELVAQLNAVPTQVAAPPKQDVVATTEPEPVTESVPAQESTEVAQAPTTTDSETAPATTAETEPATEPTATTEVVTTQEPTTSEPVTLPPPVVAVVVDPTPPIMGGGGGSTRN